MGCPVGVHWPDPVGGDGGRARLALGEHARKGGVSKGAGWMRVEVPLWFEPFWECGAAAEHLFLECSAELARELPSPRLAAYVRPASTLLRCSCFASIVDSIVDFVFCPLVTTRSSLELAFAFCSLRFPCLNAVKRCIARYWRLSPQALWRLCRARAAQRPAKALCACPWRSRRRPRRRPPPCCRRPRSAG